jgi:DNA topoisomerase I
MSKSSPTFSFPLKQQPHVSATQAGLVYVSDHVSGISRKRHGKSFSYYNPSGLLVTDAKTKSRIKSLGIPPAYEHVWISPLEHSHIQATGLDSKMRKQYRYHAKWKQYRAEINHQRMIDFGKLLPTIRKSVTRDMKQDALTKTKVLATVVRLLDITLIRVGNNEYAEENGTYGLTTLRKDHVELVPQTTFTFIFKGKSHKDHTIEVHNRKLYEIVTKCMELPGYDIFQFVDAKHAIHDISSTDVNDYLKEISGAEITAKDFRTWWSTVLALMTLEKFDYTEKKTQLKRNITKAVTYAASKLGNTPSVCRKNYIYPGLLDSYLAGTLSSIIQDFQEEYGANNLSKEEQKTEYFLSHHLRP